MGSSRSGLSPFDPEVEFQLEQSGTSIGVDGYGRWEYKYLTCLGCGESVELTEEPSAGVDDFPHAPTCPYRFAKSEWYREQFE